jgi:hypothetical protein
VWSVLVCISSDSKDPEIADRWYAAYTGLSRENAEARMLEGQQYGTYKNRNLWRITEM